MQTFETLFRWQKWSCDASHRCTPSVNITRLSAYSVSFRHLHLFEELGSLSTSWVTSSGLKCDYHVWPALLIAFHGKYAGLEILQIPLVRTKLRQCQSEHHERLIRTRCALSPRCNGSRLLYKINGTSSFYNLPTSPLTNRSGNRERFPFWP